MPIAARHGAATTNCDACAIGKPPVLLLTIATNAHYYSQAAELAESAAAVVGFLCTCVAVSDALRHSKSVHTQRLAPLLLPGSSTWRPPREWCAKKLSGWRHAGILKMHAIEVLLHRHFDLLLVDVDWRFVSNPLAGLRRLGVPIVAARDQTRHMLNVGAMFVQSTAQTRALAVRSLNRTFGGWDQAVWTEEAGASGARCCWAPDIGGRYLMHPPVSRSEKLKHRGILQDCATAPARARATTLAPPRPSESTASKSMWRPPWRSAAGAFNEMDRAFYRFRCSECDNACTRNECKISL